MSYVSYPVRFAWDNFLAASGITLTTTSETVSLPWTNTAHPFKTKVGQSGLTDSFSITWQLVDAAQSVKQFAMLNHNIPVGSTVTLLASTVSNFASTPVNVGLTLTTNPEPMLYDWAAFQTYEYWRLQVDTPANQNTSIGHIFLGPYTEVDFPARKTDWAIIDPSIQRRGYAGSLTTFDKPSYRVVDFSVSALDQEDRRALQDVYEGIGLTPMYVLFDPFNFRDVDGYHRLTMFCYFLSSMTFKHIGSSWHEGPDLRVEEVRE